MEIKFESFADKNRSQASSGLSDGKFNTAVNVNYGTQKNSTSSSVQSTVRTGGTGLTGGSKLSYEQVMAASNELNSAANEMNSLLDEMRMLFSKIGQEDVWSGTAASSAKETFDALSAKFPEFYEAVSDCSKYLNSVVENYRNVDSIIKNI